MNAFRCFQVENQVPVNKINGTQCRTWCPSPFWPRTVCCTVMRHSILLQLFNTGHTGVVEISRRSAGLAPSVAAPLRSTGEVCRTMPAQLKYRKYQAIVSSCLVSYIWCTLVWYVSVSFSLTYIGVRPHNGRKTPPGGPSPSFHGA